MGMVMIDGKKYDLQSEFAQFYMAAGKQAGRAELILRQLERRFGELSRNDKARVKVASIDELDAIGQRLLTSSTLQQTLGHGAAPQIQPASSL